jgi:hypothetical protein
MPSLDGVFSHESLVYEGISRPLEILRAFDSPAADSMARHPAHEGKVLERYFYDLYGVFMKRLSQFVLESEPSDIETVNLQAMLQEMIKVKKLRLKA